MDAEHRISGSAAPDVGWAVGPHAAWTRTDDGTAVVMDMTTCRPARLSDSGTTVWEVLTGGVEPDVDLTHAPAPRTTEQIAGEVAERYGVEPDAVRDDVAAFLTMLDDLGVMRRA